MIMAIPFLIPSTAGAKSECKESSIKGPNGESYCTKWNGTNYKTGQCSCETLEETLLHLAALIAVSWVSSKISDRKKDGDKEAVFSFDANDPFQLNLNNIPDWAYVNLNFSPSNTNYNSYLGSDHLKNDASIEFSEFRKIISLNAGVKFE